METVNFQLINCENDLPLPQIYTCEVAGESQDGTIRIVKLRRLKASIIFFEKYIMQPREILFFKSGNTQLIYGFPHGKSWSQGGLCANIKII